MSAVTSPNLSTFFLYIILLKQSGWHLKEVGRFKALLNLLAFLQEIMLLTKDKWTSIFRLKKAANCPSKQWWKPWLKVTLNIPLVSSSDTIPRIQCKNRLTWHKFQGPEEMIWQGKLLKITEACEFEAKKGKYSHTASSFKN
jgi:hypothetical protein